MEWDGDEMGWDGMRRGIGLNVGDERITACFMTYTKKSDWFS